MQNVKISTFLVRLVVDNSAYTFEYKILYTRTIAESFPRDPRTHCCSMRSISLIVVVNFHDAVLTASSKHGTTDKATLHTPRNGGSSAIFRETELLPLVDTFAQLLHSQQSGRPRPRRRSARHGMLAVSLFGMAPWPQCPNDTHGLVVVGCGGALY